jgi:hypothetical protein
MVKVRTRLLPLACLAAGCNVSATAPSSTGGIHASADAGPNCDKGLVVLLTDYTSTQIALTDPAGKPLSPSFLSTASTKVSGVAYALSGDIALPTMRPPSGLVVLLDRYGTDVVTWSDPSTAKVLAQLPLGTGFESNPQDYVETDGTHALVSRWGVNDQPGKQPFDGGSDVLVVDIQAHAIKGRIAMPTTASLPPRPAGMIRIGTTTLVVLQNESEDFMTQGESVLVGIVDDAVAWQLAVTGLKGCNRPALSPSGRLMALSCEGHIDANGNVGNLAESAVALYDVTSLPPKPLQRYAISDQLTNPSQDRVSFASETLLVGKTQTALGAASSNQAFALDTTTGKAVVLRTASLDANGKGKGVAYGDFVCSAGCAKLCILADSDTGALERWSIESSGLKPLAAIDVDPEVGLPPVAIGAY